MITITHTHAEGTLVDGTAKGDGSAELLKRYGFRWSRNLGQWYVPQSRDREARQNVIDGSAKALRDAGFEVEVHVDNVFRSAADRYADQAERGAARAEALDAKADRLAAQSDEHEAKARAISSLIPMGQPILVGHHSEGRHRRDLARIETNFRKSVETHRESEDAARRADAARHTVALQQSPGLTQRKITRLEASLRDIQRKLDGTWSAHASPADGEWRDRLLAMQAKETDEVTYLRGILAEMVASGVKIWGPDDFKVGDEVGQGDRWYRVVRVNKTTLTIDYSEIFRVAGHTGKVSYSKVTGRREAGAA